MGQLVRSYLRDIAEVHRDLAHIEHRQTELAELKQAAAKQFAARNGWRLLKTTFSLTDIGGPRTGPLDPHLGRLLDHPLFFRKDGACIAIVAQVYDPQKYLPQIESLASGLGLTVVYPPNRFASIHNPGVCVFAVITEPDVKVKWLWDQSGGN